MAMGKGRGISLPIDVILRNGKETQKELDNLARQMGQSLKGLMEQNNIPFLKGHIQGVKSFDNWLKKNGVTLQKYGEQISFIMESINGLGVSGTFNGSNASLSGITGSRASAVQQMSSAYKELIRYQKEMWSLEDSGQKNSEAYTEASRAVEIYQKRLQELFGSLKNVDSEEKLYAQQYAEKIQHELQFAEAKRQSTLVSQQARTQQHTEESQVREYVNLLREELQAEKTLSTLKAKYKDTNTLQARAGIQSQEEYVAALKERLSVLLNNIKGTKAYADAEKQLDLIIKKAAADRANANVQLKQTNSLMGNLKNIFRTVVQSGLSWKIFSAITQGAQQTVDNVKELDKALVNLQIVNNSTRASAEQLLQSYNKLAIQMGATTTEVADGAIEWQRQGYNAADAAMLTKDSLILSKVGAIETGQATEYLTSALKGYQLEAKDAISVIDMLTSVDLVAVTPIYRIGNAVHIM